MTHTEGLRKLCLRAIAHYRDNAEEPWIVKPSIPIVYFGDVQKYSTSALKILTVGLNPSNAEFSQDRFGLGHHDRLEPADLEEALSRYFQFNPYHDWFRSFETLLQPLGASFYGARYPGRAPQWWAPQSSTALHTDIASPLATMPTWSGLPDHVKVRLQKFGLAFWLELVQVLKPDIILLSVAKSHLDNLGDLRWRTFDPFPLSSPNHRMMIAPFQGAHIVWGKAQVRPYFYLRNDERSAAARTILEQPELSVFGNHPPNQGLPYVQSKAT